MASNRGFIANNATQAGVATSYSVAQGIALDGTGTLDSNAETMPGAVYLSHIELNCIQTGGTSATIQFFLSWDNLGDYPLSGESAATTLVTGLTTATHRSCALGLDVWIMSTDRQTTAGTLYLWCKTNAGTVTVNEARIFWAQRRSH